MPEDPNSQAPKGPAPKGPAPSGPAPSSTVEQAVRAAAELARLDLDECRVAELSRDFGAILHAFAELEEVDVEGTEALERIASDGSLTRPDEARPSFPEGLALREAPAPDGPFFSVPRTLGGDR